jgi:hypothetical protein
MKVARSILVALAVALSAFLPVREARAGDRPQALTDAIAVHPGATCVDATALAEEVGTWLGSETVDADVWVRVEGSPDDSRIVSFEMGRGQQLLARRRFAPGPERCEHLQAVVGLAIALAIKVSLLDELVGPPPEKPAPERSPLDPQPWALGGDALMAFGVLPGAAFGASAHVERAIPPNFVLRLGLLGLASWDQRFGSTPGAFDTQIVAARFDACVRMEPARRLVVRGCAGLMAGGLLAQGRDFPASRSASTAWTAAANALEVALGLTERWSLGCEGTLVLPLASSRVGVRSATGDVVEARDLSSVGVTVSLGPAYRF